MAKKYRLCCLTKNKTNPAYEGARIGGGRLAESMNCEFLNFVPDKPDDETEQEALLNEALNSKPDAILISPVHTTALNATLQKVLDAKIPLIFFVTSAEGIKANTFVTANNHSLAVGIAEYLFKNLGNKGNIAILDGLLQSPTSPPRTKGFLDAAAAFPDINIVASRVGNYQFSEARDGMAEMLEQHPKIDGVLAANDIMSLGALEALNAANRKATIIGLNAMPDAIKAIQKGDMLATVGYDAMSLVCIGVQAAVRILDGLPVPELIELPAEIVDASNCDAWDRPYEERPLPLWENVVENPS